MNVYALVHSRILAALQALQADGALPHGDLACNAALVLAKAARMRPRDIADKLGQKLVADADIDKTEVAGPGFLNLSLRPAFWHGVVAAILREGADYGRANLGRGERINVEFVSTNPTGPIHVGHGRGAVFGDALCNLLQFVGYEVTREYYVNDAGAQVDALARSVFLRYREALGEKIGKISKALYPGEYLKPVGVALAEEHGSALLGLPEERWLPVVRDAAVAAMLAMIKEDLVALSIRHDVFFSERSLTDGKDEVAETIEELRRKGLVVDGRLEKPKGYDDGDWGDREQTLFRSTDFGDDVDRALMKWDGSYTYFAADMAYHRNKLARGFKHLINVFGADHAGYLARVKAAVAALSDGKADLDIKVCQLVWLLRAGQPLVMSKRAGTFVTLREVIDEVGRDPVRFMLLYRKNDAPLDFDLAKVLEQSKDNPVFYVQYAHARAQSVLRMAKEVFPTLSADAISHADLGLLQAPGEIDLIKKLADYPNVVEGAARAHEPHRLAFYLYDLASTFHTQWTKGNERPDLRFIQASDGGLTAARLALIRATAQVLASGLALIGVQAPDEMR
jgi:arginyl-tRNA synthetase